MKQYKVYVKDGVSSITAQEYLFNELGYKWFDSAMGKEIIVDGITSFLFLTDNHTLSYFLGYREFKDNDIEELTFEELLRLKPEGILKDRSFDIEPFDKVLGRDENDDGWRCALFSCVLEDMPYPYTCTSAVYSQIIKYTPELKKYIGTTEEIPGAWK